MTGPIMMNPDDAKGASERARKRWEAERDKHVNDPVTGKCPIDQIADCPELVWWGRALQSLGWVPSPDEAAYSAFDEADA